MRETASTASRRDPRLIDTLAQKGLHGADAGVAALFGPRRGSRTMPVGPTPAERVDAATRTMPPTRREFNWKNRRPVWSGREPDGRRPFGKYEWSQIDEVGFNTEYH